MNRRRIETADVFRQGLWGMRCWSTSKRVLEIAFGICPNEPFGQVVGLDEKEPVIRGGGHLFVDNTEHLMGRNDVQHRQLLHALRMVQRQAM